MREPYSDDALPVISDIHGNLAGLRAVLSRLEDLRIQRPPLLLGDLIWTHFPEREPAELAALLDAIMALPVTGAVRGNTDDFFVDGMIERWSPNDEDHQQVRSRMLNLKSRLSAPQIAYLRALPDDHAFTLAGLACLACHASPLDNAMGITLDASIGEAHARLAGRQMDCLVTGHLHTAFTRQISGGPLHVSVGAVGRHPNEYDGIVDFAVLDATPSGLVVVHHRLLQPTAKHPIAQKPL